MSGSDSAPEQVTESTVEVEVPAPRRIDIVGYTESRKEAHWGDPSWEKWLCNDLYRFCPPGDWHRVYDVHAIADIKKDAAHDSFLKGGSRTVEDGSGNSVSLDGRPVYVFKTDPEWETSTLVPKDDITDAFGDYFSNSISWMVAHAMLEIRHDAQKTADIKLAAAGEHAKAQGQSVEDFFGQTSIGLHAAFMHDYEAQCAIHVYGVDMATGGEYCVGPETRVLTADLRWIPASEIRVGDDVIAFDEQSGKHTDGPHSQRQWRVATVEAANMIVRPSYRLEMDDGTELISSAEHRWLTHAEHMNRWKATEDMVTPMHRSDRPTRIVRVLDVWERADGWEAGYLAAALDGEGHLSQRPQPHCHTTSFSMGFAQRENAMADSVRTILEQFGFDWSESGHESTNGDGGGVATIARPTIKYALKGGKRSLLRLLGQIRPPRLLSQFDPSCLGTMQKAEAPAVVKSEFIGDRNVIALKTSEGTFVAEGLASHNSSQRPSCEWILGVAQGRGIETYIPISSDLLKVAAMYGAESDSAMYAKFAERRDELKKRFDHLRSTVETAQTQMAQIQGALETTNYVLDVWCNARGTRDNNSNDAPTSEAQLQEAA